MEQEDVFYYLTVMNENYEHPATRAPRPGSSKAWPAKGRGPRKAARVQLLGSGTILAGGDRRGGPARAGFRRCCRRVELPELHELAREAMAVERWNLLHPTRRRASPRRDLPQPREGPVVAATDYMRLFADQIRPVPRRYQVLGTDGFGRSDFRKRLRDFFEVDRRWSPWRRSRPWRRRGSSSRRRRGGHRQVRHRHGESTALESLSLRTSYRNSGPPQ